MSYEYNILEGVRSHMVGILGTFIWVFPGVDSYVQQDLKQSLPGADKLSLNLMEIRRKYNCILIRVVILMPMKWIRD